VCKANIMKRIALIPIIALLCLPFYSLRPEQKELNKKEKFVMPDDSIIGIYLDYNIKRGEFIYDSQSGIEAYYPLPFPDTISIHSLNVKASYKFVESYQVMHSYESESLYMERLGTWSFFHDTLTLSYERELKYKDKTKRVLINSLPSGLIFRKHEKLILVYGVKLWEANNSYSSLNLLKQ